MVTGSKELIRDINSTLVLETIINNNPISRAAISKKLGLTKATISAIVQELMNRDLVIEIGCDDTELGRKPILLSFNKKAGYIISVDIGVDTISALLTDLGGEDCSLKQVKTPEGTDQILSTLCNLIESMMLKDDKSPYGLVGISLGIHGLVNDNQVSFAPYYNLSGINLGKELEEHFGTPVYLENEANLSVLGEKTFMYDYPNIANISIHSGIGLGIIINNQLYTGYNGRAGEFGHTIIEVEGRECPCGNHGCLEQYVSERALLKEYCQKKNIPHVTFDEFANRYQTGEKEALDIMDKFIKYMSVGINNILNAYNPDIVIINSSFTIFFPGLTRSIEQSLSSKMNSYIHILPSSLQDSSILLGGICVVLKNFLGISTLKLQHNTKLYIQ